jgi:hypothetical protein
MPWCETCSKFWTPSSMKADGSCPSCGRVLAAPAAHPVSDEQSPPAPVDPKDLDLKELAGEDAKVPWHFKLLVALLVAYLLWRLYDLVHMVVT